MKRIDIKAEFGEKDIRAMIERYHFEPEDARMIRVLAAAVLPLISAEAFVIDEMADGWLDMVREKAADPADDRRSCVAGIVTLGNAFDRFQDVYSDHNCLSEAYMIDCIGLELLMKSYEAVVHFVQQETGRFVERLIFPGDAGYPMSIIGEIYRNIVRESWQEKSPVKESNINQTERRDRQERMNIDCNEQYQLSPRKSAAILLPLTEHRTEKNVCDICVNCRNRNCVLKKPEMKSKKSMQIKMPDNTYSYGYQRIFGKEK